MEPIEFACIFTDITKKLSIEIDIDIIAKIYDIYEGSYENYTLLELINLVEIEKINCPWNKKAIIKTIKNKKLNIPKKYEEIEPTKWIYYEKSNNIDYIYLDCIYTNTYFKFYEGDIIQLSNGYILKLLNIIKLNYNVKQFTHLYFMNININKKICILAEDFINMLDNDDITILQNLDRCYFIH